MSQLPSGTYTAYSMPTAAKTVVLASGGLQFGYIIKIRGINPQPVIAAYLLVPFALPGSSHLPAGTYTAYAMPTASKTVVLTVGTQFGNFAHIYTLILFLGDASIPRFTAIASPLSNFLGKTTYGFLAISDPIAIFRGLKAPGGFFDGVAYPTLTIFGYQKFGLFVAEADPRELMEGVFAPHFIATASPIARFLPIAGQDEQCVTGTGFPVTQDAPNYVY